MNSATFLQAFLVAMTTALALVNFPGCEAGRGNAERRAIESGETPKTKSLAFTGVSRQASRIERTSRNISESVLIFH